MVWFFYMSLLWSLDCYVKFFSINNSPLWGCFIKLMLIILQNLKGYGICSPTWVEILFCGWKSFGKKDWERKADKAAINVLKINRFRPKSQSNWTIGADIFWASIPDSERRNWATLGNPDFWDSERLLRKGDNGDFSLSSHKRTQPERAVWRLS